eukprot:CAMPEP_0176220700 /NCGR_PEP_ID=MMETSP0121_2-20121125/19349_1 /TAXON_ID=160619 /ORGANISM="Kryptoperidinium foliaceum, Strain CCMP 1326" /LENGTH=389 /DNA_ID=CAMNT_0017559881 /DNA_START=61 /DNA_END=1227 /DNA_ORIENTATION=+
MKPLEEDLLGYLEVQNEMSEPLSLEEIERILGPTGGKDIDWSITTEDGWPLLHLTVMNEHTSPEEVTKILAFMLEQGASPMVQDGDGDTALKAALTFTEEVSRDPGEDVEVTKAMLVAAVRTLLACPAQVVDAAEVASVCSWLRHYVPAEGRPEILAVLRQRAQPNIVDKAWCSEELLQYLERLAYEDKGCIDPSTIRSFIERGASPAAKQNNATALLLAVLNPYSSLEELHIVFQLFLTACPEVAAIRDGFRLSPLQWAADYTNIALQHGLRTPNPAALLALMPAVVTLLPPDLDAGEVCLKAADVGQCPTVTPAGAPPTRFLEGQRVLCRVDAPGAEPQWEEGVVVGLWYREPCWPASHPGAPYEVRLDIGVRMFALVDHDRIIRAE